MAEEADQILLFALRSSLRDAGGIPERVQSVSNMTADVLVSVVARSVTLIDGHEEGEASPLEDRLPSGVAARHRLCAQIASRLKELGFEGDIGYNQLLYPSQSSSRTLLTWLVDRLPRTDGGSPGAQDAMDADTALRHRIRGAVGSWMKTNWRLPTTTHRDGKEWKTFDVSTGKLLSESVPEGGDVLPSLLEVAAASAIAAARAEAAALDLEESTQGDSKTTQECVEKTLSCRVAHVDFGWGQREVMPSLRDMLDSLENKATLGRLAHAAQFEHCEDDVAVRSRRQGEGGEKISAELERLAAEFEAERERATKIVRELEAIRREEAEALSAKTAASERQAELEHEYTVRKKTLEMLPESTAAIAKLTELCSASRSRLAGLEAEWERHRGPLARKIKQHCDERSRRRGRARHMVDDMKRCRAEMQQMVLDVADKEQRAKVLEAEYAKMPKNINRTLYTYRIMDIIGSIAKQKKEISKIIDDIRQVQKNNNKTAQVLRRTEAVADESVYSLVNAQKNDPAMVQSYRCLSDLRSLFETLVDVISETGAKDREARDFEAKRKQLQSRVDANNLKRILADLAQVKAENQNAIAHLRAAAPPPHPHTNGGNPSSSSSTS